MANKQKNHPRNMGAAQAAQAQFAPVTEALLRRLADSGSYSQGRSYYNGGYIFDTVLRGGVLQARSTGQSGGPYRIHVTLAAPDTDPDQAITTYDCTCPRGDFCKHLVATCLTW